MARTKLANLIAYILGSLSERDAAFGKTKLAKLLYLSDVEFYRRTRERLADVDWLFYYYGPYSPTIDEGLNELGVDVSEEEVTTRAGFKARKFQIAEPLYRSASGQLTAREKRTIDQILDTWALEELNPLLSYVYFHTEPMVGAHRGEYLDFSKIEARHADVLSRRPLLPDDKLNDFRRRFTQALSGASEHRRLPLAPTPRFDEVYRRASERFDQEEAWRIAEGGVGLDDDAKQGLSTQGE
ncbi:MAG: SocA family protein [Chloroflexi bacterium]|nr:SocA family protein [Chloroflexota bacterium]